MQVPTRLARNISRNMNRAILIAMRERGVQDYLVVVGSVLVGGFTFFAFHDFAFASNQWCTEGDGDCIREWLGALSGWAATIAAFATIPILVMTLNASRKSSEQQLRAYLLMGRSKFEIDGNRIKLEIRYKNSGQTPAYDVRWFSAWKVCPLGQFLPETFEEVKIHRRGDIAPGQEVTTNTVDELTLEDGESVKSGRDDFIFYGTIEYRDVFGNERRTDFRFQSHLDDGKLSEQMLVCTEGNRSN
jgi:hypothetical protein